MACFNASSVTVPSCSISALPTFTSARAIPGTPESAVKTARVQCAQLIPEILSVVTMRANIRKSRGLHLVGGRTVDARDRHVQEPEVHRQLGAVMDHMIHPEAAPYAPARIGEYGVVPRLQRP